MLDLIGNQFGSLVVIANKGYDITSGGHKKRKVEVKCSCGTVKDIRVNDLRSGRVVSCGCVGKANRLKASTTHGMSNTRFFDIYCGMIKRCTLESCEDYLRYSSMAHHPPWFESFESFRDDMFETYEDGLTLDRIDPNLGYFPWNCRWATPQEQARNKPKNKNNTTGVTGVAYTKVTRENGKEFWSCTAFWREDNKSRSKSFSVIKYGEERAFALACAYRKEQIDRLNSLGYGYTETHGL